MGLEITEMLQRGGEYLIMERNAFAWYGNQEECKL